MTSCLYEAPFAKTDKAAQMLEDDEPAGHHLLDSDDAQAVEHARLQAICCTIDRMRAVPVDRVCAVTVDRVCAGCLCTCLAQ